MKAYLLAAGLGTRLKPLTDSVPKCMVAVRGKPMLEWWFELLLRHGVSEVMVNTHHLREQVSAFIASYNNRATGLRVFEAYEPRLLGSGGMIFANRDFVREEKSFLICYCDNLTDADLSGLMNFHREKSGLLTMGLFRTDAPRECGIVSINEAGLVISFEEKPRFPQGNLANAGIYAASWEIFNEIPTAAVVDIGKDVLPRLCGRAYGYEINGFFMDIGSPSRYEKACGEWKHDYL